MEKKKEIEGGKKKVSRKRKNKAQWMWVEQAFFKIDELSLRLDKVESDIREIKESIRLIKEKSNNKRSDKFEGTE